ncbi:MAG: hypothetical protein GY807_15730 [Gammaproteobacteria bacterium]|nr:hypothetical protein [Gammaproteobacteria bacterium]
MKHRSIIMTIFLLFIVSVVINVGDAQGAQVTDSSVVNFPHDLQSYDDKAADGILEILKIRARQEPFNVLATLIFFCAIIHTFMTSRFLAISHRWEHQHEKKIAEGLANKHSVHLGARLFHFLGEVEAVFGIWAVALFTTIFVFYDWSTVVFYADERVNFTEAEFVVIIMTLAATRPILKLTESIMWKIANLMGGTLAAWWFTILTLGPIMGSLITEPAAMTISALLLADKLYELQPSKRLKYGTIGLLFVNISVCGTLTHFAAPPVLMVVSPWDWDMAHMFTNFGWKAVVGAVLSNGLYFFIFRKELSQLQEKFKLRNLKDEIQRRYLSRSEVEAEFDQIVVGVDEELSFTKTFEQKIDEATFEIKERLRDRLRERHLPSIIKEGFDRTLVREAYDQRFEEIKLTAMRRAFPGLLPEDQRPAFKDPDWDKRDDPVPVWVTLVHLLFLGWTVLNAHNPELFVLGFLLFLGFAIVTSPYQNRITLKPALLVGFFLAGIVIHGGVQGWWIEPVLGSLSEVPLMLGATILTAFNDNAAITFLSTLVPGFTDSLKYSVVAGAVAGGGLTVIANAPNPAGQSILKKYFKLGVSPLGLLMAAIAPTAVVWFAFLIL